MPGVDEVIPEAAKRLSGIQKRRRFWIPGLAASPLARDDHIVIKESRC